MWTKTCSSNNGKTKNKPIGEQMRLQFIVVDNSAKWHDNFQKSNDEGWRFLWPIQRSMKHKTSFPFVFSPENWGAYFVSNKHLMWACLIYPTPIINIIGKFTKLYSWQTCGQCSWKSNMEHMPMWRHEMR